MDLKEHIRSIQDYPKKGYSVENLLDFPGH